VRFPAALDPDDDWQDEGVWIKANPNLGVSVKIDDLRRKATRVDEFPFYSSVS
jgi:phage terminase large subunit-like protein